MQRRNFVLQLSKSVLVGAITGYVAIPVFLPLTHLPAHLWNSLLVGSHFICIALMSISTVVLAVTRQEIQRWLPLLVALGSYSAGALLFRWWSDALWLWYFSLFGIPLAAAFALSSLAKQLEEEELELRIRNLP